MKNNLFKNLLKRNFNFFQKVLIFIVIFGFLFVLVIFKNKNIYSFAEENTTSSTSSTVLSYETTTPSTTQTSATRTITTTTTLESSNTSPAITSEPLAPSTTILEEQLKQLEELDQPEQPEEPEETTPLITDSTLFRVTPISIIHQKSKLTRLLKINKHKNQICVVQPFSTTLQEGAKKMIDLILDSSYTNKFLEISLGDLPYGVEAYFLNNGDSVLTGNNLGNQLSIYLAAQLGSQKGSFNIPIIFSEKDNQNNYSDTICQFNLIIQ